MYSHLRIHSEYSLLCGAVRIARAVAKARDFKMPALALTDYGNIFGAVEFFLECKKAGVHPVLGSTLFIPSYDDRTLKQYRRHEDQFWQFTLYVKNSEGYRNLSRLLTESYLTGFYYRPRVDTSLLKEMNEGLICSSGGFGGEISFHLHQNNFSTALAAAEKWARLFGENFYIELQDNGLEGQAQVNAGLVEIAKKIGAPYFATANVHYMERQDAEAFEVMRSIQLTRLPGTTLDHLKFSTEEYYFRNTDEMQKIFADFPEALEGCGQIVSKADFEFDFNTYHFPKYATPPGKTLDEVICEEAQNGLKELWPSIKSVSRAQDKDFAVYQERLQLELDVITRMGFSGYFLIVSDFIRHAKSQGIPVGPGRGSGAGSLVAYALRITNIDPIPYHLLFERFLNPERISMPDFDIDFCQDRRSEVIEYVTQKYKHVCQIITFGKMKAKAVIRDVGRALGMEYDFVDKIAKLIPATLGTTLSQALEAEHRLKDLYDNDGSVRHLIDVSLTLEGLSRHASTHAAGVVMTDKPLTEFVPLYKGSNGDVVAQFDMKYIEKIGLIKFDFLGLKTLTVINKAVQNLQKLTGDQIDIDCISMDDPAVYELLGRGDGAGIFQLESQGMRELMVRLKPGCFEDIIALVALYRPGPLGSGMVDDFIERKKGVRSISYPLPQLESILKDTYGVIVYQEQVMQVASALANYSLGEADLLRRAMGKKKAEEMAAQRARFLQGAEENKIDKKRAEEIFDLMAKFAEYGFNKSHSAAYALVSYQTAWLKAHHNACYMAALMSTELEDTDKILECIGDLREHGIKLAPPDINRSLRDFAVISETEILYGLGALKGVGEAAIESILEARASCGSFHSLAHFLENVDQRRVTKKVVEVLVMAGVFDFEGVTRKAIFSSIEKLSQAAARQQREREQGQWDLFGGVGVVPVAHSEENILIQDEWTENEKLGFEKEAYGFYFSGHPLQAFAGMLQRVVSHQVMQIPSLTKDAEVAIGGTLTSPRVIKTKSGDSMAFSQLEDLTGKIELVIFPRTYKKIVELLTIEEPVIVKGKVDITEEGPKLIVDEVGRLAELVKSSTQFVEIHVPWEKLTQRSLSQVIEITSRYKGDSTLIIRVTKEREHQAVIEFPALRVMPCEPLQFHLNKIFAGHVVKFG